MNILEFIHQHPILSFLLIFVMAMLIDAIFRSIAVMIRGWPKKDEDDGSDL